MTVASESIGSLEIRSLRFDDLDHVLEIERSAFTTPWREVTFRNLLSRGDTDLFAAIRDGGIVGYAVAWTVVDQAELGNVAVAPHARKQGIGRLLVREALRRVQARGAEEVFLEVRESNHGARSLYTQCGFQVIGRRKKYYNRPVEDALVMRCDVV